MKALTLHPYWAWAIVFGSKRIENRTWRTNHRGPLAIHVGKKVRRSCDAREIEEITAIDPDSLGTPEQIDMIRGKVIAVCNLVDVVELEEIDKTERWAAGPYCWKIEDVQPVNKPVDVTGSLGLWECSLI